MLHYDRFSFTGKTQYLQYTQHYLPIVIKLCC